MPGHARRLSSVALLVASIVCLTSALASAAETVYIDASDQASLLVQALGTPNTVVHVANHVQMNLSNRSDISIASGVRLLGRRTPRQRGARLYTTTFPGYLFRVVGDNVRISGLRIDGGEMGVADAGAALSVGIGIQSALNVEIDNNEIYGWRGSAVEVLDDGQRIAVAANALTAWIHDNYIHHNQHQRREGYGVVVSNGAYALIEKNVFDWNRHAIAGDGSDGSGYFAYRNLVLENGGLNFWLLGTWLNTHMFDMHAPVDPGWQVKGVGDCDGDGRSDILWRHTDGQVAIWHMAGESGRARAIPGERMAVSCGPSSVWATSTATAAPTFSGAMATANSRSGSGATRPPPPTRRTATCRVPSTSRGGSKA
jgi:hypothetical protein